MPAPSELELGRRAFRARRSRRSTLVALGSTLVFFVVAYLGITVPVVGVGEIATRTSLTVAAAALAVLVLVLSALAALLTRRHPTPA